MSNMSKAGTTQAGTRSYADGPYRRTPGTAPADEDVEPRPGRAAARRRRAARRPDALSRLLPQALVVACLAGGSTAYLAGGKAVQLSVDGRPSTLHTFAGSVEELLQRQGIEVGDHDIVAPDPDAELQDGDTVAVRYGRPIALTLDGRPRRIWTTAGTVDGALRQLGVRADGAYLSASAARRSGGTGWSWTSAPNAR